MNVPFKIPLKMTLFVLVVCFSVLSLVYFLDLKFQQPREFKIKVYDSSLGSGGYYYVTAVLNCTLPEVPEEMQIMEVISHNYSEAEAIELAEKLFNMTPPFNITWYDTYVSILNDAHGVLLFYEGGVGYIYRKASAESFPSSLECKRIADEFLNRIAMCGYIPQLVQLEFKSVKPVAYRTEPTGMETVTVMGVSYALKYNGIPTAGYGFVEVDIGGHGKIVALHALWRNVSLGGVVRIAISPEEAIRNLGEHLPSELYPTGGSRIKKMIINKVELAYYMKPPVEKQNELLPVYLLNISVIKEDGTQTESSLWTPAKNDSSAGCNLTIEYG